MSFLLILGPKKSYNYFQLLNIASFSPRPKLSRLHTGLISLQPLPQLGFVTSQQEAAFGEGAYLVSSLFMFCLTHHPPFPSAQNLTSLISLSSRVGAGARGLT